MPPNLSNVNKDTISFNNAEYITGPGEEYHKSQEANKVYEEHLNKIFHPINSPRSETKCHKIYHYLEEGQKIKMLVNQFIINTN